MIITKCSGCDHEIGIPARYLGQYVPCPSCQTPIRATMHKAPSEKPKIHKQCPICSQKLVVPLDYAGHLIKCINCDHTLRLPAWPQPWTNKTDA